MSSMRVEKKYATGNDWSAETMDSVTNTPSTNFNLLRTTGGTGADQRIGLRLFAKYLMLRFHTESSASNSIESFRVDLWMDKQPDATNPAWTDLYVLGNTDTDNLCAPTKDQARQRFKLLKSKIFSDKTLLASTTGPVSAPSQHNWKWYVPLNKALSYNTTGAANPNRGCNIFLIAWSDVAANTPKIWAMTQFCFTDQ